MAIASVSEAFSLGMELADERIIAGVKNLIALGGAIRNDPAGRAMAEETLEVGRNLDEWDIQWGATYTLAGFGASLGRPLASTQQMTELRALTAIGPPARQTALLLLEGTQPRMEGRTRDSLGHYGRLDAICRRGGALHQTAARGGHTVSAFAAGVADPDEGQLERLRDMAIADGDDQGTTLFHTRIGLVALRLGELAPARTAFDAAVDLMPDTTWARWADAGLVAACIALADHVGASAAIQRLRASQQPLRLVIADLGVAAIAADDGTSVDADTAARNALAVAVEHGLIGEVPGCLETCAYTASLLDHHRVATVLIGAARRLREECELHGRYLPTNDHLAATVDRLQTRLGDDDFATALIDGAALSWPDAFSYAAHQR